MKRFILIIAFILTIGIVIFSCKKDSTLAISGPNSISLSQYSTLETVKIFCNNYWTAESSANWLSFSPTKGNSREGGAELTINCEANPEYEPRTAYITVHSGGLQETIAVTQDKKEIFEIRPTYVEISKAAQSVDIDVASNVGYSIIIYEDAKDWISSTVAKTSKSETITLNIAANNTGVPRMGTIFFKGETRSLSAAIKQSN